MRLTVPLFVLALFAALPAHACEPDGETAGARCEVPGGFYRLVMPERADGPVPAMLHLHGWGASSRGALNRFDGGAALTDRGYALLLPEGVPRAGRTQRDWAVRDGQPHPRDDIAFLEAVIADATARGVDPQRILLSGFSRGGSFVWDVACARPDLFRGFAPISGAFWEPLPEGCAGAVSLYHSHGWTDRVVPLEGRSFREDEIVQGDVFASLKILRETLGCDARQPDRGETHGDLWLRHWESCDVGRIDFELHPGGHAAPEGWLDRVLAWFAARSVEEPKG